MIAESALVRAAHRLMRVFFSGRAAQWPTLRLVSGRRRILGLSPMLAASSTKEFSMFKFAAPVLATVAALGFSHAFAAAPSQDALMAQARVTKEQATHTAIGKVPNGVVRSAELEREHGKLIWSFDMAQAGRSGVTEVQVDAVNGRIVSLKHESASQEAGEASAEAGEK
jgi:hypothetical protein